MHTQSLLTTALLLPSTLAAGLYTKSSPVLQVTSTNFDSLINRSNHTSIIEFYAPWCGHCQNLKPAYEKAAKSLSGLAKVAAVNCDEESNKPLCGQMGVQGFPTLKIARPGKKSGRPAVEDYQGARSAKAIVDAVKDKIPNHVARLKDGDYQAWLDKSDGPKAVLFTDKGVVSALMKALAIDFLGAIDVAQIRDKEKQAVEVFGVEKFPTLVLVPGEGKDPLTYDGEMKKEAMVAFLSQAASPNPDPAPKKSKASSSSANKKSASKASSSFSKASASHASSEKPAPHTSETLEDSSNPTESPNPEPTHQQPVELPKATPIPTLHDGLSLQQKCLNDKASTCILALLPQGEASPETAQAIQALSEIHFKHQNAKRHLFPFYQLPTSNSQATALRSKLALSESSIELIALNGKRAWYRHFVPASTSGNPFTTATLESWIDEIRMGDGAKEKLPAALIAGADALPKEEVKVDWDAMPEGMAQQLKDAGLEYEFEEIDDVEYEAMMKRAEKEGKAHDEL